MVGEFRGAEIVDLLVALSTGHDGGAVTMHAGGAAEVPRRCAALGVLAGVNPAAMAQLLGSAVDVVVQLARDGPRRVVDEVAVLERAGDGVLVAPVWTRRVPRQSCASGRRQLRERLSARGATVPEWLGGA